MKPSNLETLLTSIQSLLGESLLTSTLEYDELSITVSRESIVTVLTKLKTDPHCLFILLLDIGGVDYVTYPNRFHVVYHLLSLEHNLRLRVKVMTDGQAPIPSVISVFPCADWYERETWDLFGIPFDNHPNMRRLLTDYHFEGHPLRKDFPLTGYVQVRYDPLQKKVIEEPVSLPQDFRSFDFLSPWEGILQESKKNTPMKDQSHES